MVRSIWIVLSLIVGLTSCIATMSDISRIEQNQSEVRQEIGRRLDLFELKIDTLDISTDNAKIVSRAAADMASNTKAALDSTSQTVANVKADINERGAITAEQLIALIVALSSGVTGVGVLTHNIIRNKTSPTRVARALEELNSDKTA